MSTRPMDFIRFLPSFCLFSSLFFSRDVAAIELGGDVLSVRLDVRAGDDLAADRRLDRHLEVLARDELLEFVGHLLAVVVGLVLVNDRAEGVDGIAVQENVDTDQRVLGVAVLLVIERGVTLRATLQLVEEVDDDFGERQPVVQLDALGREILHLRHLAATGLAEIHDRARVVGGREDARLEVRLGDGRDLGSRRHLRRVGDFDHRTIALGDVVLHGRRRRNQRQAELALEALAHDLHVEQAEETAPETEPQRARRLRLEGERAVVEPQLLQRLA